jgi:hypothetical protein
MLPTPRNFYVIPKRDTDPATLDRLRRLPDAGLETLPYRRGLRWSVPGVMSGMLSGRFGWEADVRFIPYAG